MICLHYAYRVHILGHDIGQVYCACALDMSNDGTCRFWAAFIKRFALSYRTVVLTVCLSVAVLSVTLVYCGQTVGRIKMKLGKQVGPGPGHTVLEGDPAQPRKGVQQPQRSKFTGEGPCLLWPNGWMDQDETWHRGRPRPSPNCVK